MACLPDWYYGSEIEAADMPRAYLMGLYSPPTKGADEPK